MASSRPVTSSPFAGAGTASYETPPPVAAGAPAPPSVVADHDYPNVPDNIGGQEAATAPGTGGRSSIQQTGETAEKVPFKEQVNGYAKKIAGTIFRNDNEKELGDAKLNGQA